MANEKAKKKTNKKEERWKNRTHKNKLKEND